MRSIPATLIMFALLIFVPILQRKLSNTASRLPGLILPLMCFGYSLVPALKYTASEGQSAASAIAVLLIMANLPTFALLAIYRNSRIRKNRKSSVDKMNIQDL